MRVQHDLVNIFSFDFGHALHCNWLTLVYNLIFIRTSEVYYATVPVPSWNDGMKMRKMNEVCTQCCQKELYLKTK